MSKSFIDAVEQRARQLGEGSTPTEGDWRQALTETLAAAGPVAWRRWDNDYGHWVYYETNLDDAEQLFTAPPADARDARIADGQGETYYKKYLLLSSQYTREIEALTDQLAAAQAALANRGSLLREPISATNPLPPGCYCKPGQCAAPVIMGRQMGCRDPSKRDAAIATDQKAAGSGQ